MPTESAVGLRGKHSDKMNMARPGPYGVAGANANQPGAPPRSERRCEIRHQRDNEDMNYEDSADHPQVDQAYGQRETSLGCRLVDGTTIKVAGKNGAPSRAKIGSLERGKLKEFEDPRGQRRRDRQEARRYPRESRNMEFTHEDFEEAHRVIAEKEHKAYITEHRHLWRDRHDNHLSFFFFVVRPFIKWMTENTVESVDTSCRRRSRSSSA